MATIEGGSLGNENHPVVLEVVRNLTAVKSDVKLFLSAKANKPRSLSSEAALARFTTEADTWQGKTVEASLCVA